MANSPKPGGTAPASNKRQTLIWVVMALVVTLIVILIAVGSQRNADDQSNQADNSIADNTGKETRRRQPKPKPTVEEPEPPPAQKAPTYIDVQDERPIRVSLRLALPPELQGLLTAAQEAELWRFLQVRAAPRLDWGSYVRTNNDLSSYLMPPFSDDAGVPSNLLRARLWLKPGQRLAGVSVTLLDFSEDVALDLPLPESSDPTHVDFGTIGLERFPENDRFFALLVPATYHGEALPDDRDVSVRLEYVRQEFTKDENPEQTRVLPNARFGAPLSLTTRIREGQFAGNFLWLGVAQGGASHRPQIKDVQITCLLRHLTDNERYKWNYEENYVASGATQVGTYLWQAKPLDLRCSMARVVMEDYTRHHLDALGWKTIVKPGESITVGAEALGLSLSLPVPRLSLGFEEPGPWVGVDSGVAVGRSYLEPVGVQTFCNRITVDRGAWATIPLYVDKESLVQMIPPTLLQADESYTWKCESIELQEGESHESAMARTLKDLNAMELRDLALLSRGNLPFIATLPSDVLGDDLFAVFCWSETRAPGATLVRRGDTRVQLELGDVWSTVNPQLKVDVIFDLSSVLATLDRGTTTLTVVTPPNARGVTSKRFLRVRPGEYTVKSSLWLREGENALTLSLRHVSEFNTQEFPLTAMPVNAVRRSHGETVGLEVQVRVERAR